jgi:hypothetical protein
MMDYSILSIRECFIWRCMKEKVYPRADSTLLYDMMGTEQYLLKDFGCNKFEVLLELQITIEGNKCTIQ